MIAPCQAPPSTAGFLEGLLSYVDCQAQSIAARVVRRNCSLGP